MEKLSREEIQEKVMSYIIEEQSLKPEQVKTESLLIEDLGFDSLDFAEMALDLEEQFNIELPSENEEIKKIRTVNDVVNYLFNAQ